mmetsp:Transcript_632/g.531  ORF Transcript_632/g.531 Transcript_632/m.531 type:complete len:369 (-) Transcript_632:86-1192(-)
MGGSLVAYQRCHQLEREDSRNVGRFEIEETAMDEGIGMTPPLSLSLRGMGALIPVEDPRWASSSKMRRIMRYTVVIAAVLGIICLHSFLLNMMVDIAPGISNPDTLKDLRGTEQLYDVHERSFQGPLAVNQNCAQDGSVCICSSHESCRQWTFQVGDVLIFEPAWGANRVGQWIAAGLTTMLSGKDAMHVAAVSDVYSQTPDGIMILEALKPPNGIVQKNSLRIVIHRWPLIGFWIRRADPARFPLDQNTMSTWSNSILNQPYDKAMVVPLFRRWVTHGRYISEMPDVDEKRRAIQLYRNGGPGMWVCSQLIAWFLAFPGGININNFNDWPIKKLQDFPADFLRFPIWDGQNTHIHCYEYGCYLGVAR